MKTIKSKLASGLIIIAVFIEMPRLYTDEPASFGYLEMQIIAGAMEYLGTPYVYGGTSKDGMDCSGFVYTVYKTALGNAPRISRDWMNYGSAVQDEYRPADILLFAEQGSIFHVAIYIGDNCFVHAASQGAKKGVIISSLDESYWKHYLYAVRRLWNE